MHWGDFCSGLQGKGDRQRTAPASPEAETAGGSERTLTEVGEESRVGRAGGGEEPTNIVGGGGEKHECRGWPEPAEANDPRHE